MSNKLKTSEIYLEPSDNQRLISLTGPFDENIKQIERRLGLEITYRENLFRITGKIKNVQAGLDLLQNLYVETVAIKGIIKEIEPELIHLSIQEANCLEQDHHAGDYINDAYIKTRKGVIKPRNANQNLYISNIVNHDICFGVGPAGTGKTYLAVAAAVDALNVKKSGVFY